LFIYKINTTKNLGGSVLPPLLFTKKGSNGIKKPLLPKTIYYVKSKANKNVIKNSPAQPNGKTYKTTCKGC